LNGIPTGTTYSILFGNISDSITITLNEQATFSNFIDRLWKAVGVRLLTECLTGLLEGKKYRFGDVVVSDYGMELVRYRLFGNEQVFCRWDELAIWDGPGVFCIGKKGDKTLNMTVSYQDEDNIHILEAALRMFWKRGGDRLSSLLKN
jgi:hypothetical protein